jgi:hypothetical protein
MTLIKKEESSLFGGELGAGLCFESWCSPVEHK